jgi:hypothetical protein
MAMPEGVLAGTLACCANFRLKLYGRRALVAEAGADGHALAADGAAAAEHGCASLGLHARAEAMCLHAFAAIGLKCALGHDNALLFPEEKLRLDGKYLVYRRLGQESSGKCYWDKICGSQSAVRGNAPHT